MKNPRLANLCVLAPTTGRGAVIVWTNAAGGSFGTAANWSPNSIPGSGDFAVITNTGDYTVALDSARTVGGLQLGELSGVNTQTLSLGGQSLTLNGSTTINSRGLLNLDSGTLAGSGVCNVSGFIRFNLGVVNRAGPLIIDTNGTLHFIGTGNHDWPGVVFTNFGTVIWSGGNIRGNAGTVIYNYGLWQAESDNEYNNALGGCCAEVFNNLGVFRKAAGTGTTAIGAPASGVLFNNAGLLDVQSGTVSLATAHNLTGGNINIGITSLSNFGRVALAGAAAFTGNFSANLNGGYIPITNNSFPVITYDSLSGRFTTHSLPFADAWTTNYSPTVFSLYVLNARPILTAPTNQIVDELTLLTVTNTATDLDVPTNTLTYILMDPPVGASIDSSGVITWTPDESQGPGTNLITTVVTDNGTPALRATNSFLVVVNEINVPPVLPALAQTNVNEVATLALINTAVDSDIPVNSLSYALIEAPDGATIDTNGVIVWTPTEGQGPGTNTFTTVVTDTNIWAVNTQSSTVTNTFTVVVNEVNVPPELFLPASTNIDELVTYSANAVAVDADIPLNALTFALVSGPAGLTVSPTGRIEWTPDEGQGPGTNTVTIRVTDLNAPAVNEISFSVTNSYQIVVNEVNVAPVLPVLADTNILELTTLVVTNTATDGDLPANPLTYLLLAAPVGAVLDTNGVITWTPTEVQGPSTNIFTTVVMDTNSLALNAQSLSTTNTFTVVVGEVNLAPVLTLPADTNINEMVAFTANAAATDPDQPANLLTFALVSGPIGLSVATTGAISWTPSEAQGPGTHIVTISVTDTNPTAVNATSLSVTSSFSITVNEVNLAPVLTPPDHQDIHESELFTALATVSDPDLPANAQTFGLVTGPAGLTVSPAGLISWTPSENQGPGTNLVVLRVTDNSPFAVNATSLSVTSSFELVVLEMNTPPILTLPASTNLDELTTFNAQATATDADNPTNLLSFALVSGPPGLTVSPTGLINWTPTEAQGPSTNGVQVRVTDVNLIAANFISLSVTGSFELVVREVNVAPVLTPPPATNINEMVLFSASVSATDADEPANPLTYSLVNGPSGLTVSPTGGILWTPTEDQGPGTNLVTIRVTDTNAAALTANSLSVTSSFEVVVGEVNVAPVLGALTNRSVNPGQIVGFTATATDPDVPANGISYSLLNPPSGADITPTGIFSWRPGVALADTTNVIQVRVQDTGTPALSDTNSFSVVVAPLAPVVLEAQAFTNGQFTLKASGLVGPDYVLQAATEFSNWLNLSTNTPAAVPFELTDPEPANSATGFTGCDCSPDVRA